MNSTRNDTDVAQPRWIIHVISKQIPLTPYETTFDDEDLAKRRAKMLAETYDAVVYIGKVVAKVYKSLQIEELAAVTQESDVARELAAFQARQMQE